MMRVVLVPPWLASREADLVGRELERRAVSGPRGRWRVTSTESRWRITAR